MKNYYKCIELFYNYLIIINFINVKHINSDFAITPYLSLIYFKNGEKLIKHCIGLSLTWGYYAIALGFAQENNLLKENKK